MKLFRAAAHNPAIAKSSGIKQSAAERMSKEGVKMAGGGMAKINRQDTRHGKMDMPFTKLTKYAGYSGGGDVDRDNPYSGPSDLQKSLRGKYASEPESTAAESPQSPQSRNVSEREDGAEDKKSTPQQGRYGKTGNQARGALYVADEEDAKKRLETAAEVLPVGRGVMAAGKVGAAVRVPGRTYAERKRFLEQSEKESARTRGALRENTPPPAASNIYGKRGFTGKQAQDALIRRMQDKGYAKGGMMKESKAMVKKEVEFFKKKGAPASMIKHEEKEAKGMKFVRGGGIEQRGKTKGTQIRMASGGIVKFASGGSVSARADGIAQRGKTNCKMR
jgi:hypothetical protein